ncbi:xanthosine triphosphate pyrophosphatase [Frankia casuarinae]|jgi:XTP/dITP diphosphohydrolase|uniref:Ham1-like protein n=1 Tax=Frankia casuarinae (strain DSM 45818 / CECT 9043 / HFP020203 / CcI3) TaxID=106370 RepID=Q2JAE0_FRACC|nr:MULTISPECIES: RdgB/HAM1 family non-canonical purine NTP pyrophosphatase [Frankia]ABD11752.1 Ham1-like protein [Frankia casuarinae]ETA03411.1 xanthosine triphosphate pyrophosphatase [Frankia sp. CcI6]EYT93188.1 xanthosine triphosphate pyrophosphatase [Frankia casuarinae]KDA42693.1 xanthosine triphosphate pyrophosphatase [Frankia sp. BMG5.23]OFB44274.1 non-canonical purine NTP pyrophosphatase, RdgB/HAM1 family [Frankia sp. CgIM4]
MIDHVSLITGNEGKAREYAALLGIEVKAVKEDLIEIQSLDVEKVVRRKAEDAYSKLHSPVLVDDTGLTLSAWNGLPGALVAWFLDSVGAQGLLDMAASVTDRTATVTTALGYADADGVRVFTGTLQGVLTTERRGQGGFGYDSIFAPDGGNLTFAEMTSDQKNAISHRRLAVDALRQGLGL